MSEIGDVLTELGVTELPPVFAQVMPDLMNVITETNNTDNGGGKIKASTATAYANVPVTYEAREREERAIQGGKQISIVEYLVTFPSYMPDGSRINVTPSHRLRVLARGAEPVKTFRIEGIKDISGVYFEAICTKEN